MPPFGVRFKPEAVGKRNKAGWKIRLQRPWWASYASGFRVLETGVGLVGCLKMWFCQQTHFTQSAQWGNPRQCYVAVDSLYHYLSSFSMGTFCEIAQGSHVAFLFVKWSEESDFISSHSAVLPNRVPDPAFLRRVSAPWRLAHPLCGRGLLCRSCIKLDGHSVFKSGAPRWHSGKT